MEWRNWFHLFRSKTILSCRTLNENFMIHTACSTFDQAPSRSMLKPGHKWLQISRGFNIRESFYLKMAQERSHRRLANISGHLAHPREPSVSGTSALSTSSYNQEDLVLPNDILSPEQTEFYNKNGFLVVRNLVSQEDLAKYRERFRQICMKEVHIPGLLVMKDVSMVKSEFLQHERAINKIQDYQHDDVLFSYCQLPEVIQYVECFTGPDVTAVHTMLINKPPDAGTKSSRHPLHQDLHYFPFRPASRIVCSWTAMEKVNRSNGCLVVLPGTHHGKLLQHVYPDWKGGVNKMYHGIRDFDPNAPMVHLEMNAGDTVFFHPLLIHGSGMNRTKGFRKAISCHYASSHCHYIDVRGTTQDYLAKEVEEVAHKKLGDDVDFNLQDLWKLRSRLVQGDQGTL